MKLIDRDSWPPNPGSDEALDQGCTCPVMDNGHGRGYYTDPDGVIQFVISCDCPIHGLKEELEKE